MKKALFVLGVLLGTIAVLAGVGATLPRDHISTRSVTLAQDPVTVFAAIVTFAEYPRWRSTVDTVTVDAGDPQRFIEHGDDGDIAMKIEALEPPARLVVRIDDASLPFGGTWTYAVASQGSGSRVTITERGYVDNVLMRFFARAFMDPAQTQKGFLTDLGRHFEQEVTPVDAPPV